MLIYVDEYIKSDLYRYYEDISMKTLFKGLIRNRSFREMYKIRLCQNSRGVEKIWTIVVEIIAKPQYSNKSVN